MQEAEVIDIGKLDNGPVITLNKSTDSGIGESAPSEPKKNFLKLLSIPITSNPFLQKNFTDSEPTNPHHPVTNTTLI